MTPNEEILSLRSTLAEHSRNYYDLDAPTISDYEYDMLMNRLKELEAANPELVTPDSPTQRVGGTASSTFEQVKHEVPLESLADVFSFDSVVSFVDKVHETVGDAEFDVEPKIDGLSVAVEYVNGVYTRGLTRGDGVIGEDVTENIRTIKSLPKRLNGAPERLIVRGEVYMSKKVFAEINAAREIEGQQLLANPRNAAAGSLRQLDPKVAAERRLDILLFNIQFASGLEFKTHTETLDYLSSLGFPTVDRHICKNAEECCKCIAELGDDRENLPFDMDGAVVKLQSLEGRRVMGSTSKSPRWAVAYKYPPEKKETKLVDIVVQVGRTGVLTPKAVVEPVRLAGTTVTNATLHNQDFITEKDIRIGDTVIVQKAGEIIPEVLGVVREKRPSWAEPYLLPSFCPECGHPVVRDKGAAAVRCTGAQCPAQRLRNIVHFASRSAMEIDGLGISVASALIDAGLISSPADLYSLEAQSIASLERMGKKSAENLISAIERSKERGLARLLFALGIPQVGQSAGKTIAARFRTLDAVMNATEQELAYVDDIGPITAKNIVDWFSDEQSGQLIKRLIDAGVSTEDGSEVKDTRFAGMIFVLTGALTQFTREEASEIIESFGGKASSSVSKKTTYVLAGENAGSKLDKAKTLEIPVITEDEFNEMIK